MASSESSLQALEGLMNEFFSPGATNQRKREIEELLNNFSAQSGSWRHCFYFLAHTQNEYVMMYALSVFENLINRQWLGVEAQDKMEIRSSLSKFLLSHHKLVPTFICNKLIKVIVCIGRLDWPHFYPDFFSNIIQLIHQPQMVTLGLRMLQTTSEELASPREDLSMARKEQLQRLLLDQIPTILSIVTRILETILDKHRQLVTTATPPPSPTHGDSNDSSPSHIAYGSSPLQSGSSIIRSMFKATPVSKQNVLPLPPLDHDSEQVSLLCLHCLSHLFSWIPLSGSITPNLLTTIFHFANFGCDIQSVQQGSTSPSSQKDLNNSSFSSSGSSSLGVLAMTCINEIMAKNCVPTDFEEYLLKMFQQAFQLLQRVTKDTTEQSVGNKMSELDERYVEKFTEFLRLFVSIHLRRFESNSHFPVLEFLTLLFKYTFQQPCHEGYFSCLDIWTIFIDYLLDKTNTSRCPNTSNLVDRYKDALVSLITEVLHKLQFRCNQSQLEEIDDEILNDDSETEWQNFLRQCLEVIAKVAELLPTEAFRVLYPPFQEYLDVYMGLAQFVTETQEGRRLNITAEHECRRLHCTLRDLCSLFQSLGRLSDHFIAERLSERFDDALSLIDKFCQVTVYGTKMKLYKVKTAIPTVLKSDFIDVHAQSLAALQAFTHWISQFYSEAQRNSRHHDKFVPLVTSIINAVTPLLAKQVPEKILVSAAHLFLSMATTVRPPFLIELASVQILFKDVSGGSLSGLQDEVQLLVCRALSNILILPWPNIPETDQQWALRSQHHAEFIQRLTKEFRSLKNMSQLAKDKSLQERAKPTIRRTLQLLSDQVESIAGEVSKTKQVCHNSLQDSIDVTLYLFPLYIQQSDVINDMMGFYLATFQSLRVQMGIPAIQHTITIFLELFTRERLTVTILEEGNKGRGVVEKFLQILEIIVQEPGSAFKAFLPTIISICMDHIYPIIAQRASPDIKPALYKLLFELLQSKWRYFFSTTVLTKLQSGAETVENEQQFVAIMQAFGQSFLQPDIDVFRQNLESLETLNAKFKLYHKKIFRDLMLYSFLNVFLQVMLHKSHDLLQEEIVVTVYNMAAVDFHNFFGTFLLQFLQSFDGLDGNQRQTLECNYKKEQDLPSFMQNLARLINDLRYYRICNNALPEGSVKLL
ncbi:exportin-6-like isoform X1 [Patiria miniata]|uniref:Importin N-terminal domain-containing protein n=1 Tax=Patiria miniata TaxID=46514 RepID=A0A914AKS5_PATMI|nr:exportin-6-like isoform X1 [Patiria miniata]